MHLSIDTKEVDNGFVLQADVPWVSAKHGASGIKALYEVYGSSAQVRHRVIELLEKLVGGLREGISEKR